MARSIATAEGRARSVASRTGSENHPSVGTAGTWRVRGEVVSYVEAKDGSDRLRFRLQRLSDSGGKANHGVRPDGPAMVLLDLSETQADVLLGLPAFAQAALAADIKVMVEAYLPQAFRARAAEVGK